MWVQLTSIQRFDLDGREKTYRPGDWVDIGKQHALRLVADGAARLVSDEKIDIASGAGVIITDDVPGAADRLAGYGVNIPVTSGPPATPFDRTLVWDGRLFLRLDLLAQGFEFLNRWEVAIPLAGYAVLADDLGEPDERARARAIVRDLRVPFYDDRMIFLRRGAAADAFLARWSEERARGGNPHLALLVALYTTRPVLLALPATWLGRAARR